MGKSFKSKEAKEMIQAFESTRNFQSLGMPSRRSPYTASCRSMPASSQSIRPRPSSALSFL